MRRTNFKFRNLFPYTTAKNTRKALVFLLVGLIITLETAYIAKRDVEAQARREFNWVCDEILTKLSTRLLTHAQLLRTGSAFFVASDSVTQKEWKAFIERAKITQNLPGIQGFGFSLIVPKNHLQQHIQRMRKAGVPDYAISPAGERDVYTSVIYLEPFSGRNLRALGYDMFSEPVRRKAMELARDADMALLSGKVVLFTETGEDVQAGTLMYVPVYRNGMPVNTVPERRAAIKGWVYSPYRMNDLMQGILGRWDSGVNGRIHLKIYDESISSNSLLFDSQQGNTLNPDNNLPSQIISLPLTYNGKKWILHFTQYGNPFAYLKGKVLIILIGGMAISLLLFSLTLSLFNTRYQAQQIAGQLTSELIEGKERFHVLLNSTAEAIYGLDLNGACTFANTACLQMLGYTSYEQLLGKNMHDLIHHTHDDGSKFDAKDCQVFKAFLDGERTHVNDEVLWRADGTSFPSEYWSYPILINGKLTGAVVTFFDISERKLSEEILRDSKEKLSIAYLYARSLIEASLDPLVTINVQGKITDVNIAAESATGYTRDYLIGTDFSDYFTDPEKARMGYHKVFEQGYVIDYPLTIHNISGKLIDVLYNANVYRDKKGQILGVFVSTHDITLRKLGEEQLKANEAMLQELNASKDRFISILAHDLKSPFNSILGFLDLLSENVREYDMDTLEQQINIVNNSAKRYYDLLEDMLMWAIAHSGKLPFEPQKLNLYKVCKDVIVNLVQIANAKNITINNFAPKEVNVYADINMVKTILRNLISNAIKFTNSGGRIEVYGEQNETTVIITVSDNGIGLEEDVLAKLFENVITTEGTAKEKGTGLGLLLCKEFVVKHDGKIWGESKLGKGSDFKFSLPLFSGQTDNNTNQTAS